MSRVEDFFPRYGIEEFIKNILDFEKKAHPVGQFFSSLLTEEESGISEESAGRYIQSEILEEQEFIISRGNKLLNQYGLGIRIIESGNNVGSIYRFGLWDKSEFSFQGKTITFYITDIDLFHSKLREQDLDLISFLSFFEKRIEEEACIANINILSNELVEVQIRDDYMSFITQISRLDDVDFSQYQGMERLIKHQKENILIEYLLSEKYIVSIINQSFNGNIIGYIDSFVLAIRIFSFIASRLGSRHELVLDLRIKLRKEMTKIKSDLYIFFPITMKYFENGKLGNGEKMEDGGLTILSFLKKIGELDSIIS